MAQGKTVFATPPRIVRQGTAIEAMRKRPLPYPFQWEARKLRKLFKRRKP
jgi:hypothetical protein